MTFWSWILCIESRSRKWRENDRAHINTLFRLTDKPIDVITFLYFRLNLLDGRINSTMRMNTLTLAAVAITVSTAIRSQSQATEPGMTCGVVSNVTLYAVAALTLLIILSVFVSLSEVFLGYDHVNNTDSCEILKLCTTERRRYLEPLFQTSGSGDRSLTDYVERFSSRTAIRQYKLFFLQHLTWCVWVIFFFYLLFLSRDIGLIRIELPYPTYTNRCNPI